MISNKWTKVYYYTRTSLLRNQCLCVQYRHKTSSTDSYQYLEKSKIATYKFQRSLPRLPIPKLSNTCHRYIEALKPIIASNDELENTVKIVKHFENGIGVKLQQQLVQNDKQNSDTSYISKPWFDYYLKSRIPLPINFNPFMVWKDDTKEYKDQSVRTSNLIVSALRFRRSLLDEVLRPEVYHLNPEKSDTKLYRNVMRLTPSSVATYVSYAFKAFPLDMSQFSSLFSSTRIPHIDCDSLMKYSDSKHIVVMRNGQFYRFDVIDSNNNILDASDVLTNIKYILNLPQNTNDDSIAVLTSEDRNTWAQLRDKLIAISGENVESLHSIDSSLFMVCLDDISFSNNEIVNTAHNFIHGCSKSRNFINRWFDKSFQLITTKNGYAAVNMEHSWGDGVAMLRVFNDVYKDTVIAKNSHLLNVKSAINKNIDCSKSVKPLNFKLNSEFKNSIQQSLDKFRKTTDALNFNICIYDKMNRVYFKTKKVSPDSMIQLAFQMAYYRINNKFCATYEACSTSAFKHGRTETLRSATTATKNASQSILSDSNKSNSELRALLNECSKKHNQLTKEAAMGQGFDRHLFALKVLAQQTLKEIPEIFTDKSYIEANHYILSTSTLPADSLQGGGFGPVVDNGFGVSYGEFNNSTGLILSSYAQHQNGQQFVDAFRESLDNIFEILEKS